MDAVSRKRLKSGLKIAWRETSLGSRPPSCAGFALLMVATFSHYGTATARVEGRWTNPIDWLADPFCFEAALGGLIRTIWEQHPSLRQKELAPENVPDLAAFLDWQRLRAVARQPTGLYPTPREGRKMSNGGHLRQRVARARQLGNQVRCWNRSADRKAADPLSHIQRQQTGRASRA